ncbi:MAG: hypothetical protein P9L99_02860 [Candidatus Lernaella stagnicola]|nr:hypothetical protein [Candidatus Lernaella stagnicola]
MSLVHHFVKTTPARMEKIKTKIPETVVGHYLFGGMIKRDFEFIMILIPLWFNWIWNYVFFTEKGIVVCSRSLWRGLRPPVFIEYDQMPELILEKKRTTYHLWLTNHENVRTDLKMDGGIMSPNPVGKLIAENIPLIQQYAPNLKLTVIE